MSRNPTNQKPSHKPPIRSPASKTSIGSVEVGVTPSEFVVTVSKTSDAKARHSQFENVTQPGRLTIDTFLEKRDRTGRRLQVPVLDKKRVKLPTTAEEDDYINATYADYNREDYIIAQAPNNETIGSFWRMIKIWQDGCKLVVCVVEKDEFSDTDPKLSCRFFPIDDKPLTLLNGRYSLKLLNKSGQKGFTIFEVEVSSSDAVADAKRRVNTSISKSPDPEKRDASSPAIAAANPEEKSNATTRQVIIMHYDSWKSDLFPSPDHLADFCNAVDNRALNIIKKVTDDYVPPVVLVSLNGFQRASALWVWSLLAKQITFQDSFDIDGLMRHLIKSRPGAFTNKLIFYVTYAVSFRLAGMKGWMATEECRSRVKEIRNGAKQFEMQKPDLARD